MPTSGDINGIAMADIADINGIDMPSGGGASEPSSGILTLGGSSSSNPVTRDVEFDQFKLIQFHSSVSTALSASDVSQIKGGRYMVGILDTSGNLWMASGQSATTGNTGSYGGYVRQFAIELTSVAEFNCGDDHALAIKTDGTLWGIGRNSDGQLGRGNTSNQNYTFDQIGTDTNWSKVSCGEDYSLATKTTGALYSAGKNQDGRTGQGTTSGDTTSWTQIGSDTDWTQISTGARTSAAIKGGTLVTWGDDTSNCLGLSSSGDQTSPDTANSDTDWQSVSVGANFIKAIKTTDGHHYHCGSGGSFGGGTRGDGSTSSTSTFTRIGSDTGWSEFIELKQASFTYLAAGKKGGSWYICGRYDGVPYIKTGGTATTSNTSTFVQLADPAPSKYAVIVSDGAKPEVIYVV